MRREPAKVLVSEGVLPAPPLPLKPAVSTPIVSVIGPDKQPDRKEHRYEFSKQKKESKKSQRCTNIIASSSKLARRI